MSTHSNIGILNQDESVTSIYCHFDGYLDGVGRILFEHYKDETKIRQLMDLGDISSLGPEIGNKVDRTSYDLDDQQCIAYGRDYGEKNCESQNYISEKEYLKNANDFAYLFKNGAWYVSIRKSNFYLLESMLKKYIRNKIKND
jgi:hypothetical protein